MHVDVCRYIPAICVVALAACATVSRVPVAADSVTLAEAQAATGNLAASGTHSPVGASDPGAPRLVSSLPYLANQQYLKKGYRARKRGSQVVYCRYEVPTGSNMRSELCFSEQQLQREAVATQNVIETMQQQPSNRPRAPVRRN